MNDSLHWYALKVFYNKVLALQSRMTGCGFECYCPLDPEGKPLIASLLFVRCTGEEVVEWQRKLTGKVMLYSHVTDGVRLPSPIDEDEMRYFILVTSTGDELSKNAFPY